jgi:hypothetical protein
MIDPNWINLFTVGMPHTKFIEIIHQFHPESDMEIDQLCGILSKHLKCNKRVMLNQFKMTCPNWFIEDPEADSKWYLQLESFWEGHFEEKIKYIQDWTQWVKYNGKYFEPMADSEIERLFFEWFDKNGIKRSLQALELAKRTIKSRWHSDLKDYDADLDLRNIRNGILNVRTKLLFPHSSDYLSLRYVDVEYLENWTGETDFYIGEKKFFHFETWTPGWDSMWTQYPTAMAKFEWFQRTQLTNHMEDELSLFCVGPRGSGKGTVANFVAKFYGNALSYQGLHLLGTQFGRAALISKLGNMDKELSIVRWDSNMIRYFKTITGQDGQVDVEIKQKTAFDHEFIPFFFEAFANQFPPLPSTDIAAVFRRTLIIEFDKKFARDNSFKANILNEVNIIFTEFINIGYTPYFPKGYDLDIFIKENAALWDKWANPTRMIIESLFVRDEGTLSMERTTIVDNVLQKMDEMGYKLPSERVLIGQITTVLKRMNILKTHSNKIEYYRPIRFKNPDQQDQYNKDIIERATENTEVETPTKKQKGPTYSTSDIKNMLNEKVPVESLGKLPSEW